ncbi:GAF domain-containing protein [Lysobacter sp. A289]
MQARLIAYPPDAAAVIRLARPDQTLRIGRVCENDPAEYLVLDHPSVSRAHAELHGDAGRWRLVDLGSKNGSHVDGIAIRNARLERTCWLRFGDIHCEFDLLTEAEAEAFERDRHLRRQVATAHTTRIEKLTRFGDLLDASLSAVLGLAHCERGFVLLNDGTDFVVSASHSLAPAALASRSFSGSVGAVRRALDQRRIVVANDIGREAWLATRESVVAAGLSALVCLPLMDEDRVLGAIYADRVAPGPAISTLDLELLQAFAENAAVWISARRTSEQLDLQSGALARGDAGRNGADGNHAGWSRIIAAHRQPDDTDA